MLVNIMIDNDRDDHSLKRVERLLTIGYQTDQHLNLGPVVTDFATDPKVPIFN